MTGGSSRLLTKGGDRNLFKVVVPFSDNLLICFFCFTWAHCFSLWKPQMMILEK